MPVATAKIVWNQSTSNKTYTRFLQLIRDFLTGNGWTVLTDKTADVAAYYFVVTYNRNTGYTGDNPIVQIALSTTGTPANPRIIQTAYESWNTGTATGTNASVNADRYAPGLSLTDNFTFYISCDSTFILTSSSVRTAVSSAFTYKAAYGLVCLERRAGDADTGTFYGIVTDEAWTNTQRIYVPKLWNGSTGATAYFETRTKLGNPTTATSTYLTGLYDLDESNKHVVFNLYASRAASGKLKGKVYGFGVTTFNRRLGHFTLLPSSSSPEWLATKNISYDIRYTVAMQVANSISTLS
jgi:hypothetical protein